MLIDVFIIKIYPNIITKTIKIAHKISFKQENKIFLFLFFQKLSKSVKNFWNKGYPICIISKTPFDRIKDAKNAKNIPIKLNLYP